MTPQERGPRRAVSSAVGCEVAIVGAADRSLEDMVRACGFRPAALPPAIDVVAPADSSMPHDVVIADARGSARLPTALIALKLRHPGTPIVLLVSTLDPVLMLEAMRAGVNECVAEPITAATLGDALTRVLATRGGHAGQVFAFVGAKGGVGTTTLAVNVATALAQWGSTLVIDLQPSLGDAALQLSAEPRFSVADAIDNTHRLDQSFFEGLAVRTDAGPWLLASPDHPLPHPIDANRLRLLLEFAARHYRYTVLDVGRTNRAALESLSPATSILVVTTQEVAAVRAASRLSDMLQGRYGREKAAIVLTRYDGAAEIEKDDVEAAARSDVRFTFPNDYRLAVEAFNVGKPLVLTRGSGLAGACAEFAATIAGRSSAAQAPPLAAAAGLIGRLSALRWNVTS
jgi:pilus assembly protein CpaE